MIKLDNRLQAILNEIDGDIVADIGCDHGKFIVSAVLLGKARQGIAVDISKESLKKTKILANKYDILNKIALHCGDGFLPIENNNIDVAVISGMGAREIVKILQQKDIAKTYILVPHQDTPILRRYLNENDFFVVKDYVVRAQKFYPIIVAKKGKSNYSEPEIYLGKNVPSTPEYTKWLTLRHKTIKNIIATAGIDAICDDLKKEWEELN